jgi:hypothetical protein
MSEENIDWEKSRNIVLTYLQDKFSKRSKTMRDLQNFIFNDPESLEIVLLSPNEVVQEVSALSELGKKIIRAELAKLGRLQ